MCLKLFLDSGSPAVVSGPAESALPGSLLEMQLLWSHCRPADQMLWAWGSVVCILPSPPGSSDTRPYLRSIVPGKKLDTSYLLIVLELIHIVCCIFKKYFSVKSETTSPI